MGSKGEQLIELGFCVKPHGIKGGFTFVLSNREDSILQSVKEIYLFPKNAASSIKEEGELYQIEKISFGNKVIAYLKGIINRNQAEELIPFLIKVPRSSFPELADDSEFYIADVVGCEVYEHSTGKRLGVVKNYYNNGMQVVFVIKGMSKDFDVPFVESFVPVIDLLNNRIEIVVPKLL